MAQLTVTQQFARRLRRERWLMAAEKDREIEDQEVAAALGVEPSTVGRWFNGLAMPREDALAKLAAYFGVTPGWLRYGEGERTPPVTPSRTTKTEANEIASTPPASRAAQSGGRRPGTRRRA